MKKVVMVILIAVLAAAFATSVALAVGWIPQNSITTMWAVDTVTMNVTG